MNLAYFIAKNMIRGDRNSKRFTKPIIQIAIAAIALGMIIMMLSLSIVQGFQKEIRNKVIGFGSHIQVTNYDSQSTYEANPINKNQSFYPSIDSVHGIKHIQVYAHKAGIIKTKKEIYGVVVKGISHDFDWEFFEKKMIDGAPFGVDTNHVANDVVISKIIADKMQLTVGEKIILYFIQKNGQLRPKDFIIKGIYQSGLEQYDKLYVLIDMTHIQKRNGWEKNQVGGFEILIDNYDDLDKLDQFIYDNIGFDLYATTIVKQNPEIFNWLKLQDINVIIIVVLMILVAIVNVTSALLILILERTNMIGILKTLGMSNWDIRKLFLYNAGYIILKGLIWGNTIGLALCLIQLKFELIKLPEASYYISVVPIQINLWQMLILNLGTLLLCIIMLIVPSFIITRISPIKAIRYD